MEHVRGSQTQKCSRDANFGGGGELLVEVVETLVVPSHLVQVDTLNYQL